MGEATMLCVLFLFTFCVQHLEAKKNDCTDRSPDCLKYKELCNINFIVKGMCAKTCDEKCKVPTEAVINQKLNYNGPEMILPPQSGDEAKRGVGVNIAIWPKDGSGKLYVPYAFDSSVPATDRTAIEGFISTFNNAIQCNTGVWRPRVGTEHYVRILSDSGCYSYVGRVPSRPNGQELSLDTFGCVFQGIAHHEMLHAMGFFHEQSRSDRDSFVEIITANIQTSAISNFDKETTQSLGTPYDYESIMHYGKRDFIKSGLGSDALTIRTLNPSQQDVIGNRNAMTATDIYQLNVLYNCITTTTTSTTKTTTTTTTAAPTTTASTITAAPTTTASTITAAPTTTASTITAAPTTTASTITAASTVAPGINLFNCFNWFTSPCRSTFEESDQFSINSGTCSEPTSCGRSRRSRRFRRRGSRRFRRGGSWIFRRSESRGRFARQRRQRRSADHGYGNNDCGSQSNQCQITCGTCPTPAPTSSNPDSSFIRLNGQSGNIRITNNNVDSIGCQCSSSYYSSSNCDIVTYCLALKYRLTHAEARIEMCLIQEGVRRCQVLESGFTLNSWQNFRFTAEGICNDAEVNVQAEKTVNRDGFNIDISELSLTTGACVSLSG